MIDRRWDVGVEVESSPGVYVMLAAVISDWTLWRFETANGVYPIAGKPAIGGAPLRPIGVAQAVYGGSPSVSISISDQVKAFVGGKYIWKHKAEMRIEGDRFVKPIPVPFDPLPYDGKRLEVFVSSMPTERSFSKIVMDQGIIDFTGVAEVVAAARLLRGPVG